VDFALDGAGALVPEESHRDEATVLMSANGRWGAPGLQLDAVDADMTFDGLRAVR
jgi:hypothetical protein